MTLDGTQQDDPRKVLVIFGGSGDLTRRKLIPALYKMECEDLLPNRFAIVAMARTEKNHEQFRADMADAIKTFGPKNVSPEKWNRFASRLHYLRGDYDSHPSYNRLKTFIENLNKTTGSNEPARHLYYLALPPDVSRVVLEHLGRIPLTSPDHPPRILIEKPFGHDLDSALKLNRALTEVAEESHIFRVDHYLAKDTVRNLLVFRFGNAIFEPLWNQKYVDHVQITAAESIGIEGRGGYYDTAGVVRDMVQNHVLQVLALIAMEPPIAGNLSSVHDRKRDLFQSILPIDLADAVFGQYEGYRSERGVADDSLTPTYVAFKLFLNNWRWQGAPFYVRSGKCLAKKQTEILIQFKNVPSCVLGGDACRMLEPNRLFIRIGPDEGIRLCFSAKVPGASEDVAATFLDFRYSQFGQPLSDAYEQILLDGFCQADDCESQTRLWRADCVEEAWKVVTPLLDAKQIVSYTSGSRGPSEADQLLRRDGRTWLASE